MVSPFDSDPHFEKKRSEFNNAIAECLSQWGLIEHEMAHLFILLMQTPDPRLSSAAFFSIVSLDAKIKMLDHICHFSLHDTDLLPKWNTLRNRISRRKERRNDIMHSMAAIYQVGSNEVEFRLRPHERDTTQLLKRPEKRRHYKTKELSEIKTSFSNLISDLRTFSPLVRGLLASRYKVPEQSLRPQSESYI